MLDDRTPGRRAYEADLMHTPHHHDGTPRRPWAQIGDVARWSWERNPTPRRPTAAPAAASDCYLALFVMAVEASGDSDLAALLVDCRKAA